MRLVFLTHLLFDRELHEHVSELKVKVCLLEQELDKNMQDLDVHSGRKLALEGENDLLREQLKKYVNIVQAQRRDSPSVDSGECTKYLNYPPAYSGLRSLVQRLLVHSKVQQVVQNQQQLRIHSLQRTRNCMM